MALYEYDCDKCMEVVQIRRPMESEEVFPLCSQGHGPMRRNYGWQKPIVILGGADYIEKAYRGEELPAGMTQAQVRAIVDAQTKRNKRGRRNDARRDRERAVHSRAR